MPRGKKRTAAAQPQNDEAPVAITRHVNIKSDVFSHLVYMFPSTLTKWASLQSNDAHPLDPTWYLSKILKSIQIVEERQEKIADKIAEIEAIVIELSDTIKFFKEKKLKSVKLKIKQNELLVQ